MSSQCPNTWQSTCDLGAPILGPGLCAPGPGGPSILLLETPEQTLQVEMAHPVTESFGTISCTSQLGPGPEEDTRASVQLQRPLPNVLPQQQMYVESLFDNEVDEHK